MIHVHVKKSKQYTQEFRVKGFPLPSPHTHYPEETRASYMYFLPEIFYSFLFLWDNAYNFKIYK